MILHNKNNLPRALFLWKKTLRGILKYRLADQDICQKYTEDFSGKDRGACVYRKYRMP